MKTKLTFLAEELKSLSKYPDRELIDYWRTIQGSPVGFHGQVGSGVPVAGPAVLTSNDATSNPLMKPLLSKYKPNTFIGDAIRKKNFPISVINFIENFVGKDEEAINARFAKMEKRLLTGISKDIPRFMDFDDATEMEINAAQKDYIISMEAKFVEKFFEGKTHKDFVTSDGKTISIYGQNPQAIGFSYDDDGNIIMVPSIKHEGIPEVVEFVEQVKKGFPKSSTPPFRFVTASELKEAWANKGDGSMRHKAIFEMIDNPKNICENVFDHFQHSPHSRPTFKNSSNVQENAKGRLSGHFGSPSGTASVFYKIAKIEGVSGLLMSGDSGENSTKESVNAQLRMDYDEAKEFMGDLYALNQVIMRLKGVESEKVFRSFGNTIPTIASHDESVQVMAEIGKNKVPTRFVNRPIAGFSTDQVSFRGLGVSVEIPTEAVLSSFNGARVQGDQYEEERETLVIGASSLQFSPDQVGALGDLIKADKDGKPIDANGNTIQSWVTPTPSGAVISAVEIAKILSGEEGLNEVLANRKITKMDKNGVNQTAQFQYFASILTSAGITDYTGKPLLDKYSQYAKHSAEWLAAKLAAGDFNF